MSELRWIPNPDPIDETEQDGLSGTIPIGNVHRSSSGRWRWRVATLPTAVPITQETRGWAETESNAKATVQSVWDAWLRKAGLGRREQ